LDGSRGMDGEPHLAGTAKPDVIRLSPADAARADLRNDDLVRVTGPSGGSLTLPLAITVMSDGVVWLPGRVNAAPLHAVIGAGVADRVHVTAAEGQNH
jgi:NADH-quinone oxidoreductase subunit G